MAVVVSVAAALAATTAGFNLLLARGLSHDADSVVRTRASAEAAAVVVTGDRVQIPDQPDTGGLESQAWVFRSGRPVVEPLVSAALDRAARSATATPGATIDVSGLHTRLYATRASDSSSVIVVAGISLAPYERTRRVALLGSVILASLALLVVALVTRLMLLAALKPVARMTADAESWSEHDLDRRFVAGPPHDELSQLAATLDGLLDRLSASLRREQRFSAEMSHELRTPLAKVQTEAQLALRRERPPREYRETLKTIVRHAHQMGTTVETLVAASQQESGLAQGRCDAAAVLEQVVDVCAGLAAERSVQLSLEPLPTPLTLGVDAEVATRVLQPVLENSCRLAQSRVVLRAQRDRAGVAFHVHDDGPGVHPEERDRIFAPGVRGSAAEAGGYSGAGLGLALARRLARAASGDVEAMAGGEGGHFVARLPTG